eukprot:5858235-Pyramimonas_sp.AAC.2
MVGRRSKVFIAICTFTKFLSWQLSTRRKDTWSSMSLFDTKGSVSAGCTFASHAFSEPRRAPPTSAAARLSTRTTVSEAVGGPRVASLLLSSWRS